MNKAGIRDYEGFAREVLETVREKPISFEVFSDDFAEMRRQALKIAAWQDNVFVKIPVTNTLGESSVDLIRELAGAGVKLNITAMLTVKQCARVAEVLNARVPAVLSVFAGRIADTGMDPQPLMCECLQMARALPTPIAVGERAGSAQYLSGRCLRRAASLRCRTTFLGRQFNSAEETWTSYPSDTVKCSRETRRAPALASSFSCLDKVRHADHDENQGDHRMAALASPLPVDRSFPPRPS